MSGAHYGLLCMSNIKEVHSKLRLHVFVNLLFWRMAAILRDSVAVAAFVRTHPRAIMGFIIRPVRPRAQFSWKTIREKVPYEGRTRRSDRAGKTCTALPEMRTALLETSTAKSSPKLVMKVNILRANFTTRRIVP